MSDARDIDELALSKDLDVFSAVSALNDNAYKVTSMMVRDEKDLQNIDVSSIQEILRKTRPSLGPTGGGFSSQPQPAYAAPKPAPTPYSSFPSVTPQARPTFTQPAYPQPVQPQSVQAQMKPIANATIAQMLSTIRQIDYSKDMANVNSQLQAQNQHLLTILYQATNPKFSKDVLKRINREMDIDPSMLSDQERNEELARLKINIKSLRRDLTEHGHRTNIGDIENCQDLREVRRVFHQLYTGWQSYTWTNVGKEIVVGIAGACSRFFDGKREFFGYAPNMQGWQNKVAAILDQNNHTVREIANDIAPSGKKGDYCRLVAQLGASAVMHQRSSNYETSTVPERNHTSMAP